MKGLQLHGEDLHAQGRTEANPSDHVFCGGIDPDPEKEIWLHQGEQEEDLLDVDGASIFYGELPALPDFPCMSSSSSSSSTPAPVKAFGSSSSSSSACSSSSSSAVSWAVLRSETEEDQQNGQYQHDNSVDAAPSGALSSTASMEITDQMIEGVNCMDVMETFGYMDLVDNNDFFDPSTIFHHDDTPLEDFQLHAAEEQLLQEQEQPQGTHGEDLIPQGDDTKETHQDHVQEGGNPSEDLAMVFLEWLKSNKESVSAEDLRRVKIKKATIECAARRLGGGKEAMKQLLKLILEWVQKNHLQRRRTNNNSPTANNVCFQDPFQNPNSNPSPQNPSLACNPIQPEPIPFSQPQWIPQPGYVADTAGLVPGFAPPVVGYIGDPFVGGASNCIPGHPYPSPQEYHMLEPAHSWPAHQFALAASTQYNTFPDNNIHQPPGYNPGYGNQYAYQYVQGHGDQRLVRLCSSATKEARKKRMARQRRFLSHPRTHNNQQNNQQNQNQSGDQQHARLGGNDNCTPAAAPRGNSNNWVYWPGPVATGAAAPTQPVLPNDAPIVHQVERTPAVQGQSFQRQVASDRRQGWKPEKNLRFLLQKVLKQSDVGNLGRIVLPKKEAETHLPELEARDGISIAMEDIGTSRVWNMRYRFWPNNKSRMYLLENTGDFVKTNGLQEGDFIVIYSDVKCGKYLIRGVKVRQPGQKSETKRPGKSQRNVHSSSPSSTANGSSSSPATTTTTAQPVK
ncbi:B3 domain-containing transcription factor ABI3 [Carica papaya]|uniref:B3 domain-containing transcription factor ABI3 n=1 Tax=Carica papaya TaxID=3649 RepID=UPI000B8C8BFE|nr:B3 domain-containing transcription factor ABI3 [Carica papaya]